MSCYVWWGRHRGWCTHFLNFTLSSILSVRLSCIRICMLCSCMSLWTSCLYCKMLSAQLCHLWLSGCWPNKGECATKVFQSNRRCILLLKWSQYLASKQVGKFKWNGVVGICLFVQDVEGSDMVSGSDKDLSDEISFGSFTKFGSHLVYSRQGLDVEFFQYWFDRKIFDRLFFCFHLRLEKNVLFSLRILLWIYILLRL